MSIIFRKYWILTTEYPPFYGGGISTYCHYTARMLSDKGHDVSVFVTDSSVRDVVDETKEGVRVIRFNPARTNAGSFLGHTTNLSYAFAFVVKQFIGQEGKPDLIEAQEYLGIAYYLMQFKHLQYEWCKDVPVLITMHSPSFLYLEYNHVPVYKYPNYWIGEMERFCMQAADVVVSPSHYLIQEVKKYFNYTQPNLFVVSNPMIHVQRQSNNLPEEIEQEIIFFGKLSPQKGTFKLLEYFLHLWSEGFTEKLFLVGGQDIVYHPEGKTMGDIVRQKYASFINAGLLQLEDSINPSAISGRLAGAKLVIVPSTVDNLPYVVLEMMALGKVVLVSKQGGQSEIVQDGVDGFIFDHNDPATFFQSLQRILQLSAEEREGIKKRASQKVMETADPELVYAQKMDVLRRALAPGNQQDKKFPFIRETKSLVVPTQEQFEKGLLSIVIPYYNMGKYLPGTLSSLQQVSYPRKHIIIVNDGSNDIHSIKILDEYRSREGITIVDMTNKGLAAARNTGAQRATGEFLAFLDADDTVSRDYYSKAIHVLTRWENVHFVGCWTRYFGGSTKTWPTFSPEIPLILFHNLVNSSALVYKRSSFMAGGQNDDKMEFPGLEDYESVISLTAQGLQGVVLPEPLFQYRVRTDSMIRKITKEKKLFLFKYIHQKYPSLYADYATELLSLANANGPGMALDNPSLDYGKKVLGKLFSSKLVAAVKRNKYTRSVAYKLYKTFIS